MPTATKERPETAAPEATKKSLLKSKKALVVAVLVLAAAGGAYKFTASPPAKVAKPTGGAIVSLTPTTLNLTGGHYLKVGVAVQLVEGKTPGHDFKTRAGQLVIADFSNRSVASLSSNADRTKVMGQLEKNLKTAYAGDIFNVFLTQFVTQ